MGGQRNSGAFASAAVLLMLVVMGLPLRSNAAGLSCGKQKTIVRVAGGVNAQRGEWTWQVSIQHRGQHICGGSVIGHRWILTAGHCFYEVGYKIVPADWKVVLGRLQLTGDQFRGEERDVAEIIVHENYADYKKGYDIALVRLALPVWFSRDISPICLPHADHQFAFGTQCWVTGWGDIGMNTSLSDPMHLQEMTLDLLSRDTCNCIFNNLRDRKIARPALPRMICAMTPDSKRGPCKGDSGGPLVCLEDGRWFQAGIMSFSMGCESLHGPIILTETKAYADWIQSHVNGATFANQTEPRPNTTDKYLCTGCGKLKRDTPGSGAEGLWPWYVSLQYQGQHACGGTLISEKWIVTAAQCFIGRQEPAAWKVLLGEKEIGLKRGWQARRTLQHIILHGAYINVTEGDDIAAAMLDHPVEFNDRIRAICTPYETHKFPFGSTCWTRGRTIDENHPQGTLGGVEVKILGPRACNCRHNLTSEFGHEIAITSQMLCATPHKSTMRCEKTVGEPLICNDKGSWFLAGISSFGKGCGTVVRPGVYTAVTAHQHWIMESVWSAFYDMQLPPVPVAKDDGDCLAIRPRGLPLRLTWKLQRVQIATARLLMETSP
uniref:serine protease 53 n=1 Tax=Euleptes europaea TaxID=460621 RepID=UPI0025419121|nr:serine protease 53 [Euleptes europaea]